MKKILIIIFLLYATNIFAEKPLLNIQHWDLKNKTRVFFIHRTELPILDCKLVFSAGSVRDENQEGLATLTNSMLNEGAKNLSSNQIAQLFETNGAEFNLFVDRDMAGMTLRTLVDPKYLNPVLKNVEDIITSPTFPESELNRLKQQVIAQIKSEQQNPSQLASNQFYLLLYPQNAYAHNPLGDIASVNQIKQSQLMEFYKKYYTGANANLILVGDISESKAKAIAEEIAGNLPEGSAASKLPLAKNQLEMVHKEIDFPSSQSTLIIGQVGITRENPDYFPLILGNEVLGGLPLSSILYDEVREKRGLAYSIGSAFNPWQYRGPFMIYLQTKSSTVSVADNLAMQILKNFIQNGPTEAQLVAAKKNMIAALPLALSSNSGILATMTNIAFYHRPLDFIDSYQKNVEAVTQDEVKNAFQKNVDVNRLVTVIVGSSETERQQ